MFKYKLIMVEDTEDEDLLAHFDECVEFINEGARNGGRTLVHCAAGISRSASICIAYLIKQQGMSFDEAFDHVRDCRQVACPNKGFLEQLAKYAKLVHGPQPRNRCFIQ